MTTSHFDKYTATRVGIYEMIITGQVEIFFGVDIDKVNALIEMYIKDSIPNWQLYDAKSSMTCEKTLSFIS